MLPHRPVLPIGQQVLYFLPYGQWVGIRSRRALVDATELHRTARQRKTIRQASCRRRLSRSCTVHCPEDFYYLSWSLRRIPCSGDSLTAKRMIGRLSNVHDAATSPRIADRTAER